MTNRRESYPLTAHLSPRKDGQPRTLSEEGWPIWRISYTDDRGSRGMMLLAKPTKRWAQMHVQRLAQEYRWTDLVVGRWHGGCAFEPAPPTRIVRDATPTLGDAGGPFGAVRRPGSEP